MASSVQDSRNTALIPSALLLNRSETNFLTVVRKTFARIYAKNLVSMYLGELSHTAHVVAQLTQGFSRPLIGNLLKSIEPEAVQARMRRRFRRKRFFAAGVNDLHVQDQHDKWKRFGLWLHNNLDPFTGFNHWLKVWWTNRNPRLIAGFYIESIRKHGGMSHLTLAFTVCI
jgi:hypothetical protein